MRGSILVLGPLLAKFKKAKVSSPGGCSIGVRPIDIHLKSLSKLGVKYKIDQGYVIATAPKGLIGAKIRFPKISVGATENLLIASNFAKGTTILSNVACEPEISDLVNFLTYVSEPAQLDRYRIGFWVILFLLIFSALAYLLKVEYWKDVK